MRIEFVHYHDCKPDGTMGFAVFFVRGNILDSHAEWLEDLSSAARTQGFKIDVAVLSYQEDDHTKYWGDEYGLELLAKARAPRRTHWLELDAVEECE